MKSSCAIPPQFPTNGGITSGPGKMGKLLNRRTLALAFG